MDKLKLKDLKDQVIVVTGASNRYGKATVRMAAAAGARVVMVSRNEAALQELADEVARNDGDAMYVVADVGREQDVVRISRSAIRTYGAFDTWINTSGISVFGKCLDAPMEDMRRLMDTNFWSMVSGSRTAIHHFRQTGQPGVIIHLGAVPSEKPEALRPLYAIASQAVSTWLDALRFEVEQEKIPVTISLIYPGADSTFRERRPGRKWNYRDIAMPEPPEVAAAILQCAVSPRPAVYVGANTRLTAVLQGFSSRRNDTFTSVPERTSADGEAMPNELTPRLPESQSEVASLKKKRAFPGSPRTLFSSIVLAGLGAGMWLLSRPKKPADPTSQDLEKNG